MPSRLPKQINKKDKKGNEQNGCLLGSVLVVNILRAASPERFSPGGQDALALATGLLRWLGDGRRGGGRLFYIACVRGVDRASATLRSLLLQGAWLPFAVVNQSHDGELRPLLLRRTTHNRVEVRTDSFVGVVCALSFLTKVTLQRRCRGVVGG